MESIVTAAEVLGSAYRRPIAILVTFYKNENNNCFWKLLPYKKTFKSENLIYSTLMYFGSARNIGLKKENSNFQR